MSHGCSQRVAGLETHISRGGYQLLAGTPAVAVTKSTSMWTFPVAWAFSQHGSCIPSQVVTFIIVCWSRKSQDLPSLKGRGHGSPLNINRRMVRFWKSL